ncbi:uncharacterized protein LOC143609388 [Bidens hawaiensis]|uniref:uncharacterized protein LOC143609388 n=1 Tax=Bidens hawaiensis TaxID=980011 RepID=UPI00404909BB
MASMEVMFDGKVGMVVVAGSRKDDLYDALIAGDWIRANSIIDGNSNLAGSCLTDNCYTALHVAATAEETKHSLKFVTNLVNKMKEEDLLLQNKNLFEPQNTVGNTAFHMACVFGNTKMAEIMMNKYKNPSAGSEGLSSLWNTRGSDGLLPLCASAEAGKYCSVKYLYDSQKTSGAWTDGDKKDALLSCVKSGFFDIAFKILEQNPKLVPDDVSPILDALARKPEGFNSRAEKNSSKH